MKKILFFLTVCVCFDFVSGALADIFVFLFFLSLQCQLSRKVLNHSIK